MSQAASKQLQVNYCSSSLLSLSSKASFFKILLAWDPYFSLLQSDNVHPKMQRVSLNLRDSLFVLSNTTMNFLSPDSQQLAKQGPAVTVTPVLTPIKPSLLSNLLVFSQINSFFPPQFSTQSLQTLVAMTFLKRGMFKQLEISKPKSQGVEVFLKSGKPCGFPKLDCLRSSSLAYLFMCLTNVLNGSSQGVFDVRLPAHYAKATAASLPLGNIRPYSNSQIVKVSPTTSSAEVPVISEADSHIVTIQVEMLIWCCFAI